MINPIDSWISTLQDGVKKTTLLNRITDIDSIDGWFGIDDCHLFDLIFSMQSVYRTVGDILEIGVFKGRSSSFIANYLNKNEKLHLCDDFGLNNAELIYSGVRSIESVTNTIIDHSKINKEQIIFYSCLSKDLKLPEDQLFRFIHVDGSHTKDNVIKDLELSFKHLMVNGIIAVDDYNSKHYQVTEGVDSFLKDRVDALIIGEYNRFYSSGTKLYLTKK